MLRRHVASALRRRESLGKSQVSFVMMPPALLRRARTGETLVGWGQRAWPEVARVKKLNLVEIRPRIFAKKIRLRCFRGQTFSQEAKASTITKANHRSQEIDKPAPMAQNRASRRGRATYRSVPDFSRP